MDLHRRKPTVNRVDSKDELFTEKRKRGGARTHCVLRGKVEYFCTFGKRTFFTILDVLMHERMRKEGWR